MNTTRELVPISHKASRVHLAPQPHHGDPWLVPTVCGRQMHWDSIYTAESWSKFHPLYRCTRCAQKVSPVE